MLSSTYFEMVSDADYPSLEGISLFNISLSLIGLLPILLYAFLIITQF